MELKLLQRRQWSSLLLRNLETPANYKSLLQQMVATFSRTTRRASSNFNHRISTERMPNYPYQSIASSIIKRFASNRLNRLVLIAPSSAYPSTRKTFIPMRPSTSRIKIKTAPLGKHKAWFTNRERQCWCRRSTDRPAAASTPAPANDRARSRKSSTPNRRSMTAWTPTATQSVVSWTQQVALSRRTAWTIRVRLTSAVSFFLWQVSSHWVHSLPPSRSRLQPRST